MEKKVDVTLESMLKILDYSSDEIFVLNSEKQIVYVNRNCEKHYGLKQDEILGKYNHELYEQGYWKPSIVPDVFERKEPVHLKQQTYIGAELLTTAIPILNDDHEIEYVFITSTELNNFKRLIEKKSLIEEITEKEESHSNFITNSPKVGKIIEFSNKVAPTDSTILIQGESGTGKGVLAYYLHQISHRKSGPFLTVNCAAIPEDLLESELFGYTGGAFTGANKEGKTGLFEAANNGTIFLDEIGELALSLQAKVLGVIQDKQFIPIGSSESKKVDIRIIAATNQNLLEMVRNKRFREDLFYRLNVIDVHMPPLRERSEDIIPLTYSFLNKFNEKYNTNKVISPSCLDVLYYYSWPGNIRQLENLIERLVIVGGSIIQIDDLPQVIQDQVKDIPQLIHPNSLDCALEETTRTLVRRSYDKNQSSRAVAKDLDISQSRASRLIREHCQDLLPEK
ncbi:sigma-54-dependent Fis family transcriptional regulator [Sporosarcina pasteurii]|nr:sigma 54-interacting transcriptional regulator [Sporosarcina pasteurii]MDS9472455.1 sigma 54-interacting transcriptional regulator [Sporosarcina pasteurii]QBQ07127.1 PAS domain S-box protein [Sporosarcina pasteurii]